MFYSEIEIPVSRVRLTGDLNIPEDAKAIVVFSHGSGSSRLSPRNKAVAQHLHEHKFATLLFDLLTSDEDRHYHNRFDIDLLTRRLISATEFLQEFEHTKNLRMGYFGASTGAASALKAAAFLPGIGAVVSRGGRPDLAGPALQKVEAPTLLIVGSLDYDVLKLNQEAMEQMTCVKKLEVIKGASHLFEETGMLSQVAEVATEWFKKHLTSITIAS